jgi:hypothetical protein
MVSKFKIDKQKSIVYCILDITDKCQTGYAKEICINLTDFLIHRFDLHGYDIFISKDEDELLRAATQEGYSHAVIISAGTSLGLSDRLFNSVEQQCKDNFFIAGHIIDRDNNSYYKNNAGFEIHQQFYIVNLTDYKELGCPTVGNEKWVEHRRVLHKRSTDYMFDDPKLPVWIRDGNATKPAQVKLHGWNILNIGLAYDKNIVQISADIRASKRYLYYEYDHVFLTRLANIKYYQFFATNFFAGWNSDTLRNQLPFDGPVEQYATVGIGFNWIKNLQLAGFTENTKVIFTDINYNCLMFMKKMVEEWDGVDYANFYWSNKPMLPNNPPNISESYKQQIAAQWQEFLTTVEDWDSLWSQIKKLSYDFVLVDYTASFNFDWLDAGRKTILNLSNLYNHSPFVAMNSLKYRISCENRLLQLLKDKDPNITVMLTARAADGFWETNNEQYLDTVDNFVYTDITQLKIPEWHTDDWKHNSSRPLGVV